MHELRSLRPFALFGFAALATATSCAKSAPAARGELILAIDSDLSPGVDFDRMQIEITSPSDTFTKLMTEFGLPGQPVSFPATLAIVGNGDPSTPIHIRVATGLATTSAPTAVGVPKILREVVTTVPADRIALLRVHLEWLCTGTAEAQPDGYIEGSCPEGKTCIGGACADWTVVSDTLPTYDDRLVFGGGSSKGDGACFDTLKCFSSATVVTPSADCTFAAPSGGPPNVAIATADGQGICDSSLCLAPLDQNTVSGFFEPTPGLLRAPQAACDSIAKGLALGIVVTGACTTKGLDLPTCGPWSAVTTDPGTFDAGAPDGLPDAPLDVASDADASIDG